MTTASKTIGPMWQKSSCGTVYWWCGSIPILCDKRLRLLANVPASARKLWVELTKRKPSHPDAFRITDFSWGCLAARFDGDVPLALTVSATDILRCFLGSNDHCYATIYYE